MSKTDSERIQDLENVILEIQEGIDLYIKHYHTVFEEVFLEELNTTLIKYKNKKET